MIVENPEHLRGIGLRPWVDKILFYMGKRVKYQPELKKLLHSQNVLNMHREYMALIASRKYKKADIASGKGDLIKWDSQTYKMSKEIADRTNLPNLFVLNFFNALYNLAATGEIPPEKWNPLEYVQSELLKKTIPTEKGIFTQTSEAVTGIGKAILPLTIAVALMAGIILAPKFLPEKQ